MRISVVVPVYNEEKYIANCLRSLWNQEEKPDEIVVVDNNSTDRTVEIAKKFGVRILKERKQGMIPARNRGFNMAKHGIIARCDADSILPRNWIKKIKEDFKKRKIDALTGLLSFYESPFENTGGIKAFMTIMNKILKHYPLHGSNYAITKKMWNKVKHSICYDDTSVHEDIDLAIHIAENGGRIGYDRSLIAKVSGRRMKNNPASFFVEYPSRLIDMLRTHHKFKVFT